jgi:transposase
VETIVRIGLDTSKSVFQLHGVDRMEQPVLRRKLKRSQVLAFFGRLPPAFVAMEACGASHYWARELRSLGHEVAMTRHNMSNRTYSAGNPTLRTPRRFARRPVDPNCARALCRSRVPSNRAHRC